MSNGDRETIVVDVPDGFAEMSRPTAPETRFGESDIVLSRAEEKDLDDIVDGLHTCFPEIWWSKHEPPSQRDEPSVRKARCRARITPWLKWKAYHPIKASLHSTGEFVGFAGWHEVGSDMFQILDGQLQGPFRRKIVDAPPTGVGFQQLMGWSDEEVKDMWSGIDLEAWEGEFGVYDRVRTEELKDAPHWYLAPLFVLEKYRGRGVGRMLLNYAIARADAAKPRPLPLYLEALPNARPVYLHCGFEAREGPDRGPVMLRNPPK